MVSRDGPLGTSDAWLTIPSILLTAASRLRCCVRCSCDVTISSPSLVTRDLNWEMVGGYRTGSAKYFLTNTPPATVIHMVCFFLNFHHLALFNPATTYHCTESIFNPLWQPVSRVHMKPDLSLRVHCRGRQRSGGTSRQCGGQGALTFVHILPSGTTALAE